MTRDSFPAAPADKFDAPILADSRAAAHQNHADLTGALDVRAAAGLQIRRLNFNRSENAVPIDFLSHAELRQLVRGTVTDVHRAILKNNLICRALGTFKEFRGRFGA